MTKEAIPVSVLKREDHEFKVIPVGGPTDYDFQRPHRHEYFEFFLFEKGGGSHFIDFVEYPIRDHSIHIVFPRQIHLVKRKAQASGYVIICTQHFMNLIGQVYYTQLQQCIGAIPHLALSEAEFAEVYRCIGHLTRELSAHTPLAQELVRNYSAIFFTQCIRAAMLQLALGDQPQQLHEPELYRQFMNLLEHNFTERQSVAFYAEAMNVTPKVLNNALRKATGKTCVDMIQERCMLEAKRLLLYTDKNIKQIAFDLNFRDMSYFTRFFSRLEEMSPKEFKHHWEEKYHSQV
jgi:AraC-like DNA-binding protein